MSNKPVRMSLKIDVSTCGVPIYTQITEQFERLIRSHTLAENNTLPSVRALADELNVNIMTVSKAYSQLEDMGLVVRLRGKGMFVAKVAKVSAKKLLEPHFTRLLRQAEQIGLSSDEVIELLSEISE